MGCHSFRLQHITLSSCKGCDVATLGKHNGFSIFGREYGVVAATEVVIHHFALVGRYQCNGSLSVLFQQLDFRSLLQFLDHHLCLSHITHEIALSLSNRLDGGGLSAEDGFAIKRGGSCRITSVDGVVDSTSVGTAEGHPSSSFFIFIRECGSFGLGNLCLGSSHSIDNIVEQSNHISIA